MNKAAFLLACLMTVEMIVTAINRALAPYVDAFYSYGLLLSCVFIALLWGSAYASRRRPPALPSKDLVPQGSTGSSVCLFGR